MNFIDLTGRKFGRLTVIKRHDKNDKTGRVVWECLCDCGNKCLVSSSNLGRSTNSCGCFAQENRVEANIKHGKRRERIYYIWCSMIQRCTNNKAQNFYLYGGKGIKVCDEWKNFQSFLQWSNENGYTDELSIDRIDNLKNYCPENCRWVSMKKQQNNRSNNRLLTYNYQTHTIAEWAELLNINARSIETRLNRGWSDEKTLSTPFDYSRRNKKVK